MGSENSGGSATASLLDNAWLRLAFFYGLTFGALWLFELFFPEYSSIIDRERMRQVIPTESGSIWSNATEDLENLEIVVAVAGSILGGLVLALPVSWVYGWTTPRKRYDRSFAQTLLVLPVAIGTVVFLVKGSLALAFSLAGIVAAIRFRTTLDDQRDAVFLFISIGIGLATGTQLLTVALVASVLFNAIWLFVAWTDFGREPKRLEGWTLVARKPKGAKKAESETSADPDDRA